MTGLEAIVEWVPVGGKLVWRGTKEVAKLLLKTNMEQWGDNLEKMLYEDIQVKYHCPKCGREWTEMHRLSQLVEQAKEYHRFVNESWWNRIQQNCRVAFNSHPQMCERAWEIDRWKNSWQYKNLRS